MKKWRKYEQRSINLKTVLWDNKQYWQTISQTHWGKKGEDNKIRNEVTTEKTERQISANRCEKWNISCHISKQRCHSHQQLQPSSVSRWTLREHRKETNSLTAIRLQPLPTKSPKEAQDVKDTGYWSHIAERGSTSRAVMSDSAFPWTAARQAPLSTEFSRQEYWSGLPLPSPGDLPDLGIKPGSPALQADALPSEPPGKPLYQCPKALHIAPFTLSNPRRQVPVLFLSYRWGKREVTELVRGLRAI